MKAPSTRPNGRGRRDETAVRSRTRSPRTYAPAAGNIRVRPEERLVLLCSVHLLFQPASGAGSVRGGTRRRTLASRAPRREETAVSGSISWYLRFRFPAPSLVAMLDEIRAINGGRCPRILWLDEEDRRRMAPDGLEVMIRSREYLYEPSKVAAAAGRPYRDVRKRLRRIRRDADPHFREMTPADVPGLPRAAANLEETAGSQTGIPA